MLGLPVEQGLYDPRNEHDACGIGFVVNIQGAKYPNQILDAQIRQSIDTQMAAKGFTKTDAENADLDLAYQASVNQSTQWSAYSTGGMRWGWGGC